jgi:E3 ubiquitin-protein ligase HERC1
MRSIFGQLYTALGSKARSSEIFRGAERWWKVNFKHEHVTDAGGAFRETVSNIADDLNSDDTPQCTRTPNQENDEGDVRDAWMPNPGCTDFLMYQFIGRLMAGAIQSAESLAVRWPPFVWKKIARFPVTLEDYAGSIDTSALNYAAVADCATEEEFNDSYEDAFTFTSTNSAKQIVSLVPGGDSIVVTFANRLEFVERLTAMRLGEIDEQCEAIRTGMLSATIPAQVVSLWSVNEFSLAVCGKPEISIEEWTAQTSFENSGPNHSNALWWEVMQSFSHEQRSQVLKFVTGRSRLPVAFKVEWQPDSDRLPRAATCFQKIYLPRYPSFAKMRERMIVAIQCMSIDTD